jgi:hypothetical protein
MQRRAFLAGLVLVLVARDSGAGVKGPFILTVNAEPRRFKAVRLQHLPKDATLKFDVRSNGVVTLTLLDGGDYARLKKRAQPQHPLFAGQIETRLAFSVKTPSAGDYFVVVLNNSATEAREVVVTVTAATDDRRPSSPSGGPET